jgi:replicative superfamily II helicase
MPVMVAKQPNQASSAPTTPVTRTLPFSAPTPPSSAAITSSTRWTPKSKTTTDKSSSSEGVSPTLSRSQSSTATYRQNHTNIETKKVYYVSESKETPRLPRNCSLSEEMTSGDVPTWGLPLIIVDILKKRGLVKIHDWQRECLETTGVIDGKSLVYSLPTSGGKTYVAEILMFRQVFVHRKVAIFVLPFVAIVMEKVKSLKEFGKHLNFAVDGYYQNNGKVPLPKDTPTLCICTIEKANMLINSLIEEGRLNEVGLVVFDELHMLGDPSRGYLLEILGTKLKYASKNSIQMVGMSATLPNLEDLSKWINGISFYRDFRPVKLVEHVFDNYELLTTEIIKPSTTTLMSEDITPHPVRSSSNPPSGMPSQNTDEHRSYYNPVRLGSLDQEALAEANIEKLGQLAPHVIFGAFHLVRQMIPHNCALVFCSSKDMTSQLAQRLSDLLLQFPPRNSYDINILKWAQNSHDSSLRESYEHLVLPEAEFTDKMRKLKDERNLLVKQIIATSTSKTIDKNLESCLRQGIAWHNSDLGAAERELIETAFRQKVLSVICCTSTLAAGVNLPARRVVLMNSKMGRNEVTTGEYRQMVGRAGRAGIDDMGESFLFVTQSAPKRVSSNSVLSPSTSNTNHKAIELLASALQPVKSPIGSNSIDGNESDFKLMRRARQVLFGRSKTDNKIDKMPPLDMDSTLVNFDSTSASLPIYSYFCAAYPRKPDGSQTAQEQVFPTGCGVDRLVLDAVAGRCAVTHNEIMDFVSCTFLAATMQNNDLDGLVTRSIKFLTVLRMIEAVTPDEANKRQDEDPDYDSNDPNDPASNFKSKPRSIQRDYTKAMTDKVLIVTTFGAATYRTPFSIETALYMREEMEKSIRRLNLTSDLQLCWLVVPTFSKVTPQEPAEWHSILLRIFEEGQKESCSDHHSTTDDDDQVSPFKLSKLSSGGLSASCFDSSILKEQYELATRVGAKPDALLVDSRWELNKQPISQPSQRFLLALVLQDIVEEISIESVSQKYSLSRGDIEGLMQNASTHAGQLVGFCKRMGWWHMEAILKIFSVRVGMGVKEDIMALVKIRGVKVARARMLYAGGYRTIRAVSLAQPHELATKISARQDTTSVILADRIIKSAKTLLDKQAHELGVGVRLTTSEALRTSSSSNSDPSPQKRTPLRAKRNGTDRTAITTNGTRTRRSAKATTSANSNSTPEPTTPSGANRPSKTDEEIEKEMKSAWWDIDHYLSEVDEDELLRSELAMELALLGDPEGVSLN